MARGVTQTVVFDTTEQRPRRTVRAETPAESTIDRPREPMPIKLAVADPGQSRTPSDALSTSQVRTGGGHWSMLSRSGFRGSEGVGDLISPAQRGASSVGGRQRTGPNGTRTEIRLKINSVWAIGSRSVSDWWRSERTLRGSWTLLSMNRIR